MCWCRGGTVARQGLRRAGLLAVSRQELGGSSAARERREVPKSAKQASQFPRLRGELETVGKGQKYITRTASLSEEGETDTRKTEMYDASKTGGVSLKQDAFVDVEGKI